MRKYIKTEHIVTGAYWNAASGGYNVKVKDVKGNREFKQHCDIFINASGILNNWRWPAIPGLDKFKGPLLHTANWDDKVELKGKHIGLIGNG